MGSVLAVGTCSITQQGGETPGTLCEHQQWLPAALHCGRASPEPGSPEMSPFPSPPTGVFPSCLQRLPEEFPAHCRATLTLTLVTTCSSTSVPPALEQCHGPQEHLPVPSACPGQAQGSGWVWGSLAWHLLPARAGL